MPTFTLNRLILRKFWKISRTVLLILIALLVGVWIAIHTTPVQNWLVRRVASDLSHNLKTTVSIRHVNFDLFNKMNLEGALVKDHHNDTLLYAGKITVNITDWFFLKDSIDLKYIGLADATVMINRKDSVWNYQFLVDYFGGGSKPTDTSKSKLKLSLQHMLLENVHLVQRDGWRGEDQELRLGRLEAHADRFNLKTKIIHLTSLDLDAPSFAIYNYEGNRPPRVVSDDDTTMSTFATLRWNPEHWNIAIDQVNLKQGAFRNDKYTTRPSFRYFDGNHILFTDITGKFSNVRFAEDSVTCRADFSTRERSGLDIKKFHALMKFHPEAMEFADLDLQTNRSKLGPFFAMRYSSFDDLGSFISKVSMDANFENAVISSDDIALFTPDLQDWKKTITVKGRIRGTVDNLHAKGLVLQAGNSTYLNGDILMRGLPDISKTYIDFQANDFRSTYVDAKTLIPQLKSITQPRIDRLEFIRFKGNFTGFINNFVTYGTVETRLGTVITDLNMKFPHDATTFYSGNIKTNDFALGQFIDLPNVGKISFQGKIDGSGIKASTLNAQLDGNITRLEVNDYSYQNLHVKGKIAKKLFNGEFLSNDPNLDAHLVGLVDFSGAMPRFDFEASVNKADLHKINMARSNLEIVGNLRFNFTGNNIDNFLGSARITNASIYHNGVRIPFDSLYIESKLIDNSKTITVMSNEFDGALVGEFSIKDLPASFQTFLSRYYPSYFKPVRTPVKNENFSFVITTKRVDDYLALLHDNLKGFNYSTITGRINTRENLLDFNAEVPQFSYKNVAVYNMNLKGTGSLDSFSLHSNIADVYISDSLHFPGTELNISSANDISDVRVITSANQALNAANIWAKVNTRPNGVSILFNESTFDINGKSWTIEKNGKLVLDKNLVSAEGVRIYNGQQEILITTHPSDIGNTNDVSVNLKKINIGDFAPYVVSSDRLEGLLTGEVSIMDPFGKMQVEMQGEAEQFRLDNDSIGLVKLNSNYNQQNGKINFRALSDNENYHFNVTGLYNLRDSTNENPLDIGTQFTDTKIDLVGRFLSSVFDDVSGFASGDLHISGAPHNLKYVGKTQLRDGRIKVNYTNVVYKIPLATFEFKDDLIDFGSFKLLDTLNNSAQITRGVLRHQSFDKMYFDFAMSTNKILALNTTGANKDPFFGKVFAKVNMTLTGPMEDMVMNIRGEPSDSSTLFIRSSSGRESGQADFIVWKVYGREMEAPVSARESKLTVLLDVTANNLADMNVIIDELTGDIITCNGHGNLNMRASTDGDFSMTGQYDIDRGNYNFNFQSLLRKPFSLQPNAGSYIRWNGDPYDADMYVVTEYEADNVKFSDLGNQALAQVGGSDENIRKYRGKIRVVATLSGKLMKPDIKFQLEMPPESPLRSDPLVQNLLKQIQSDENELNKQVAFLIIFNSFGPTSTSSQNTLGSQAVEGIVASSISGYLSSALNKQFSNIFRKIFNDESIKVNFNAQLYNGSNLLDNATSNSFAINRTALNLSLNKSLYNERLTFTFGSSLDFGITAEQARATRNLQFLPDINMEWKIRPDGKLVLTLFYRDSYNNLSGGGTKLNRSGAGISYRRDFDQFGDLFRGSRKKKKPKPQLEPKTAAATTSSTN